MKSKFNLEKKATIEDQNSINGNLNLSKNIYYFETNGGSEGPYSLNDLLSKIQSNTLVYREGIDWTEAINVPELKHYFNKNELVKPIDSNINNSHQIKTKSNKIVFIIIGASILALVAAIYFFLAERTNNNLNVVTDTNIENNTKANTSSVELNNNLNNSEPNQIEDVGTWVVIAGSYKSQDEAIHHLNIILSKGISAELLNTNDFEKLTKNYYFISVGKQLNQQSAQEISKQINEKGIEAYAKDAGFEANTNLTAKIESKDVEIINVSASSNMNSANNLNYYPRNVIDNKLNTWWSPKSNDENSWIKLDFGSMKTVNSIEILNGSHYLNFPNYGNLYFKNNRITKIQVEFSDGSSVNSTLEEIDEIQKIVLTPKQTKYLLISVIDCKQGDTWKDVCISHLKVF